MNHVRSSQYRRTAWAPEWNEWSAQYGARHCRPTKGYACRTGRGGDVVEDPLNRQSNSGAEFDVFRDTYEAEVARAISFAGQELDVYVATKARDLVRRVKKARGDPAKLDALDIGCGVGLTDSYLVQTFRRLHGVDVSAPLVERAIRTNPGVEYAVYSGDRLPYPDASFDVVFAICVLHHVELGDQMSLVNEFARVTRPGGVALVYEHNPFNPITRLVVSRCRFDEGVVLLYPSGTRRLLTEAGFVAAQTRHIIFSPVRPRLIESAERALGVVPLGAQYVAIARKPVPKPRPGIVA